MSTASDVLATRGRSVIVAIVLLFLIGAVLLVTDSSNGGVAGHGLAEKLAEVKALVAHAHAHFGAPSLQHKSVMQKKAMPASTDPAFF